MYPLKPTFANIVKEPLSSSIWDIDLRDILSRSESLSNPEKETLRLLKSFLTLRVDSILVNVLFYIQRGKGVSEARIHIQNSRLLGIFRSVLFHNTREMKSGVLIHSGVLAEKGARNHSGSGGKGGGGVWGGGEGT